MFRRTISAVADREREPTHKEARTNERLTTNSDLSPVVGTGEIKIGRGGKHRLHRR
jgi:hypothetical protein